MDDNHKTYKPKGSISAAAYLKSVWQYRRVSYSLGFGEVKNRYRKNRFGFLFAVLQVIIALGVYWAIFGVILKVNTNDLPYPLFALPGIIMWQYFSSTVSQMSQALNASENLISKLYFPRINLLISQLFINLPEYIAGLIIFGLVLFIYGIPLSFIGFTCILFLILLPVLTFGIGLWVSMVSLYHRDMGKILVQLIQFSFFITPVFFPGTIIPDAYRFVLYINPVAAVMELFRSSLFVNMPFDTGFLIGLGVGLIFLITGFLFFKKHELKIADML